MPSDRKCFLGANPMTTNTRLLVAGSVLMMMSLLPASLRAEGAIEKTGVAVGLTAGNVWLLPVKALTVTIGALSGALSYVVTGGNIELTQQIWQDTTEGPYLITPEFARKSIDTRPELEDIE